MGGEGTISGMITSLRNNELLRRKKKVFRKGKSFFDQSTASKNPRNKPIEIRHLSEEEKEYYRTKTIAQNRSNLLKSLVIAIILLGILGAVLYFGMIRIIG